MSGDDARFAARSVYLVTSGAYSDYGVSAVFSTRELAEAWIASARSPSEYGLDVMPLDDPSAHAPDGAWRVEIDTHGAMPDNRRRPTWYNGEDPTTPAILSDARHLPARTWIGWGRTVEHARRSADELRRAMLAGTVVTIPAAEPTR